MADDPHRDLLPVKEGSCINTCRSGVIDSRERHAVCKLDRYELEDRYLRVLDEVQDLKKLSNVQEDKIKRLATKLMRVAATPRSCLATPMDLNNDRNRYECLEHENVKLKDKITVLRNQILNHKLGRSRSRSRRLQNCPSSGPTTFRSEIGRVKSSSSHLIHELENDKDDQNYYARIEDLEIQKKDMAARIAELESQIEDHKVGKQREKAAENVEFIRVWRQMKQQNEQLVSAQAVNASLTGQIRDLKELLEEKTRCNKEITGALMTEKKKLSEMDSQLAIAKNSELSLRDKDEQIKDLAKEMKILQQHNEELIGLTSRYSQVERENVDLKKKISEQISDNRSLKNAFTSEQANIAALQAANAQLMGKLQDLQRNIDSLTIQLKSFQSQNEKRERTESEPRTIRTVNRETNTSLSSPISPDSLKRDIEICKNCCRESSSDVKKLEPKITVNRDTQTENDGSVNLRDRRCEDFEKKSPKRVISESPMRVDRSFQPENGSASLTPEEMMKFLDQAQINGPLDVRNVGRIGEIASTLPTEYLSSTEHSRRQREHSVEYSRFDNLENCVTRTRHRMNKIAETNGCKCHEDEMCNGGKDCGYPCARSVSKRELAELDDRFKRYQRDLMRDPFRNVVSEISTCIQKTFDNIHMSRILRDDGNLGECHKSWRPSNAMRSSMSGSSNEKDLLIGRKSMEKWKERVGNVDDGSTIKPGVDNFSCFGCRDDCRGGEFFQRSDHRRDSSNTRSRKRSGSTRDSKIVEAPKFSLPNEFSGSLEEPTQPIRSFVKNNFDETVVRQRSRISGVPRPAEVPEESVAGDEPKKINESQRESAVDSYLSTSLDQSDSSVVRAMEDEDATSGDIRDADIKRPIPSAEKSIIEAEVESSRDDTPRASNDSESVKEFNSLIRNNKMSSPRKSSSSIQDLGTVFSDDNWHEYKRRSMAGQAKLSRPSIATTDDRSRISKKISDTSLINKNAVIIRIESLSLDRECPLLDDPEIHQLYVEFSFLGYHGANLETKSVPKPIGNADAYFNYMRKFEIDEKDHQMQRSIMRAMMTDDDNPTVKFIIVSEPLPNETETKECVEVGYAFLNIRDHVLSERSNEVTLTIMNDKLTKPIGTLKITLLGAEAIRRCMV